MAGYIRQSTADIIPTATVRAAPINAEYNALRDAFAASGGHKHDGTTGEGEYVPLIADLDALNKVVIDTTNNRIGFFVEVSSSTVEQVRIQDGAVVPVTDNDIDLGTSSLEFKDLYLDGTAYIDTLAVHESATITANLTVNGNTTLGNAASDTVTVTADVASHLIPSVDFTYDLGAVGSEWRNLYIDGTANIDSLVADTADINAGTIDNTVIGGTTAAAASVTTLDASSNATVSGTLDVTGATTLTSTLAVTGNTTVGGTLGVTGATTLSSFSATSADINGGNIDGTDIGTSAVGTGAFSTVSATGNITGNLVGNVTGNVTGNTTGDLTGNVTSSGTSTFATVDINGGAIDGTTIGATSAAAITGTTITGTSLVGPLTGNVTGDVTGDLTGNVTASSGNTSLNNLTVNGTIDATNTTINNVSDPTTSAQAATKNYVDTQINNLIGGAPSTLDTLNEIADALNDDASAYATLDTKIDTKLTKAGDTMSGNLAMGANKITGLATPTTGTDAVNLTNVTTLFGSTASAATSATNAATSETNAATSATNAANSYDSFDDRYLGVKTGTLPSTDNDGDALITGALLFDGTNNVMKVWNGSEWAAASSSIEGIKSSFRYVATASQTVFSGADANSSTLVIDQAGLVNVFLNGVRLVQGSGQDYTVSAANNNVTLLTGAAVNDVVEIEVFGNFAGQSGAEVAITGGSITGLSALGVAGNASFGDNDKAIFGAGSDLQIYHSGAGSFISEAGTGNLFIEGSSEINFRNTAQTAYLMRLADGGDVRLYYAGSPKLATTSTGVDITGTITSDGLTVNTNTLNGEATFYDTNTATIYFQNSVTGTTATDGLSIAMSNEIAYINNREAGDLRLYTNNSESMRIASNGDISFYEDTGTTPKFFWDASDQDLTITPNLGNISIKAGTHDATNNVRLEAGGTTSTYLEYRGYSGHIWDVNTTERMRIDSSGNLLVGTTDTNGGISSSDTDGSAIALSGSTGQVYFTSAQATANAGSVGYFNRKTTDGDLVQFRKNGSPVGSIGHNGTIYLAGTSSGIRVRANDVIPATQTGAANDDALDLGIDTVRWKDLYLSGGVYLGGTGSANKLDDYEEGTWTIGVTIGGAAQTVIGPIATYTKIGNTVSIRLRVGFSKSGSGVVNITGLPFSSSFGSTVSVPIGCQVGSVTSTAALFANIDAATTIVHLADQAGDLTDADLASTAYIFASFTYQAG